MFIVFKCTSFFQLNGVLLSGVAFNTIRKDRNTDRFFFFFFLGGRSFSEVLRHTAVLEQSKNHTHTRKHKHMHFIIRWCRLWLTWVPYPNHWWFCYRNARETNPLLQYYFRMRVTIHLTFSDVLFSLRATAFSVTSVKKSMTSLGNRVTLRYSKMCFRNGMKAVIWNKGKSK